MELVLKRDTFTDDSTIGMLSIDGVFECYTLEDKDRHLENYNTLDELLSHKVQNKTAIPRGRYKLEWRFSPHFNAYTPHLLDVLGFSFVLMHWGNKPEDTDACLLVGQTKDKDFIGHSKDAFNDLMAKIKDEIQNDNCWIEIC